MAAALPPSSPGLSPEQALESMKALAHMNVANGLVKVAENGTVQQVSFIGRIFLVIGSWFGFTGLEDCKLKNVAERVLSLIREHLDTFNQLNWEEQAHLNKNMEILAQKVQKHSPADLPTKYGEAQQIFDNIILFLNRSYGVNNEAEVPQCYQLVNDGKSLEYVPFGIKAVALAQAFCDDNTAVMQKLCEVLKDDPKTGKSFNLQMILLGAALRLDDTALQEALIQKYHPKIEMGELAEGWRHGYAYSNEGLFNLMHRNSNGVPLFYLIVQQLELKKKDLIPHYQEDVRPSVVLDLIRYGCLDSAKNWFWQMNLDEQIDVCRMIIFRLTEDRPSYHTSNQFIDNVLQDPSKHAEIKSLHDKLKENLTTPGYYNDEFEKVLERIESLNPSLTT